jgi:hypothetical protein
MRRFTKVILIAAVLLSAPASGASQSELTLFVSMFTMATEAERHCPNVVINEGFFIRLGEVNHVSAKDDAAEKEEFAISKPAIERVILEQGAAKWCETVMRLYGPNGTLLKGAILDTAR